MTALNGTVTRLFLPLLPPGASHPETPRAGGPQMPCSLPLSAAPTRRAQCGRFGTGGARRLRPRRRRWASGHPLGDPHARAESRWLGRPPRRAGLELRGPTRSPNQARSAGGRLTPCRTPKGGPRRAPGRRNNVNPTRTTLSQDRAGRDGTGRDLQVRCIHWHGSALGVDCSNWTQRISPL